jgi:PAS domain S-box-containing protein
MFDQIVRSTETPLNKQIWRILHIDDDEDDHLIVRSMLKETQSRTVILDCAVTLEEARKKLCEYSYQAVLIDYDLGVETGIELIRELVAQEYTAPLILLTGRGSYEVDVEAMLSGATLYLTKNEINPLLLERSIRYAIERKQAEAALKERDRKLSVALDAAQLGTWAYNFADKTIELDERARAMYHATQSCENSELIIQNNIHPDDIGPMIEAFSRAGDPNGEGRFNAEYRVLQPDGSVCWLSVWGLAEFEGQGPERRAVRLTGASRDITWEKQAELSLAKSNEALQESERSVKEIADRFKAVLENSLDVAYRRDLKENRYDYMSPVVEQVLGFSVDEMVNMNFQETLSRIHPDDLPVLEKELVQAADEGKGKLEYRFKCKDGQYRWLADYITVSKDSEGQPLYRTGILRDVTDQVRADQALRTSEERFRLASRAVTGILYDWTVGREELYQSDGLEGVVGYKPGEEPGGTTDWWPRNIHPDDYPRVQTELYQAINGLSDSFSYEYRIRHKEGHWVHIWDQGYIVRDEHGKALRVVGTCTDISDRVHSEKALRESELNNRQQKDLLEAVLQALPVGVWITDQDGRIIGKNAQADRMWGGAAPLLASIDEYQAYMAWDTTDGKRLETDEYPLARVLQSGQPIDPIEVRVRRFDGTDGVHLVSAAPIKDGEGRLNGAVAITVDITERRQAEVALQKSDERFRLAARASNDAIWDWDLITDVILWNEAITDLYGFDPAEQSNSSGDWWKERIHPEDYAQVIQSLNAIMYGSGDVWSAHYRFRKADETYADIHDRGWVVRDEKGRPVRMVGVMRDITTQNKANIDLAAYADRLKRSNEELENFAFVASHDLQEPLRKILMFGQGLRRQMKGDLPDQAEEYLNRMQNAAERMQAMIHGLLDLSRVSTHGEPFKLIDLTSLAEEVVSDLEARIHSSGGQVIIERLPEVEGDSVQLRRLLLNLIGNGLKFHQEGLPPVVRVTGRLVDTNKTAQAVIAVEDNGTGFGEPDAERIFQPFVRLNSHTHFEGSGIGLAICRKIAERHGGSIKASSRPGEGSRFTVILPVRANNGY